MEYITTDLTAGQKITVLDNFIEPLQYELENNPQSAIELSDFITEVADNIVPVWNHDRIEWWTDMGSPEPDDYQRGMGDGIIDAITWAIYEAIEGFLHQLGDGDPKQALQDAQELRAAVGVSLGYANLARAIIK